MKEYHVCHDCQMGGMINCSEFDVCGGDKSYPVELREMIKTHYKANTPLSIIAEKAFDMGKKYTSELNKDEIKRKQIKIFDSTINMSLMEFINWMDENFILTDK